MAKKKTSKRKQRLINLKISAKAQQRANNKKLENYKGRALTKEERERRDAIIWRGVQLNTQLNEADKKLNKLVKKPKKDKLRKLQSPNFDYDILLYFRVMEKNDFEEYIFESGNVISLNGLKRVSDSEKIYDLINMYWQRMASKDVVELRISESGDAISRLLDSDEIPDDNEFDIM